MSAEMGTFRVDIAVENPERPGEKRVLRSVLVDTGAELSWFPADILQSLGIERRKVWHFRQADGTVLSRSTGGASVYVGGIWTLDEVVFGEPGDLVLLGSRSLEGLNLRIDPVSKRLMDAGPAPAAGAVAWPRSRTLSLEPHPSSVPCRRFNARFDGLVAARRAGRYPEVLPAEPPGRFEAKTSVRPSPDRLGWRSMNAVFSGVRFSGVDHGSRTLRRVDT